MFSIKQLKDFMEKKLGVTNDTAKLAEESVLLYLEELDEQIVPPTIHDFLPDPIVFQTYSFMDES